MPPFPLEPRRYTGGGRNNHLTKKQKIMIITLAITIPIIIFITWYVCMRWSRHFSAKKREQIEQKRYAALQARRAQRLANGEDPRLVVGGDALPKYEEVVAADGRK
ncbi:hypothetical protein QBC38DRAFT_461877 [Podospora fimiseda]|uniref:Uncharacterized protein n=1 Tax=Podospora fimiseda TaxID=252190 RepID=A0AAN7BEQ1_9PEZI|nr:hypothetical protein QBC38DRAFT_461877 [Podospora fimiseda]